VNADPHSQRAPDDDRPTVDARPFLSIPYWLGPPGDDGTQRPLPSNVLHYLCSSIRPGPYEPGQPLDVTVDIANHGAGNATVVATVSLYWADPNVGFTKPAFFGATAVAVAARGGRAPTPVVTGVIPASAPAHICLLARVTHPLDAAGAQVDPVGDRHWAQRNIQRVVATPSAPAVAPFNLGNPLAREASFELRLDALDGERLAELAGALDLEPVQNARTLRVGWPPGNRELSQTGETFRERLVLDRGEQRPAELFVGSNDDIPPGQIAALELTLLADGERTVGGLAIVVRGD
jgi:hypothetical protein